MTYSLDVLPDLDSQTLCKRNTDRLISPDIVPVARQGQIAASLGSQPLA